MQRKNFKRIDNEISKDYFSRKSMIEQVEKNNSDKYSVIKQLLLPSSKYIEILECGGGAGFYTKEFLKEGFNVTCIDLSVEALERNKENAKKIGKANNLKTFSGNFIEFCKNTDKKFDQVVFIKVFHHFDSLENIYCALDVARKHCKPQGRIVIFEPNGNNKLWKVFLSILKDNSSGERKWIYEQNMRFTIAKNFDFYFKKRKLIYKLDYHYIIPSIILNRFPKNRVLSAINKSLERSFLKKWAFNLSVVYDNLYMGGGSSGVSEVRR